MRCVDLVAVFSCSPHKAVPTAISLVVYCVFVMLGANVTNSIRYRLCRVRTEIGLDSFNVFIFMFLYFFAFCVAGEEERSLPFTVLILVMGNVCVKTDAASAATSAGSGAPHEEATQSETACLLVFRVSHEAKTEPGEAAQTYRDADAVIATIVPPARVQEEGGTPGAHIPSSFVHVVRGEDLCARSTQITNTTSSSIAASTASESAALGEHCRRSSSCATLSGDRLCFATSPAANPLFAAAGSKSESFDKKPSCSTKSSIKGFYVLPETPACDGLLLPQEVVHEGENITALPQLVDAPPLDPASATSFEASTQTYFVAAAGLLSLESENCDADDGVAWRSTMSSLRCPSEGGASGAGGDSARRSLRQQVTIDVMRLPRFKGFV